MIIDFHTHIFPPEVREKREDYLRRDPTFAEMYTNPKAKIATAEDLLRSMDGAGVDVSVALGFAWREHELCVRHNDYLLGSAAKSNGRVIPFCTINMALGPKAITKEVARCASAGARGLGELRPENQGWDLNSAAGHRLAGLAARFGLILSFHVSEPVGHEYPGKHGLRLESFYRFAVNHPELRIVGAHLAGGLPFFRDFVDEMGNLGPGFFVDTAAWHLIYRTKNTMKWVVGTAPCYKTLFGSDYPLVSQLRAKETFEKYAGLMHPPNAAYVLGRNAQPLLRITDKP